MVSCSMFMFNAIVSPRTRGPWRGMLPPTSARWYTQNAVPTQGGAHKRRSVATAGVMLFKGPQARRYTQNAVPTQGGAHKKAVCGHRRSHVI